MGAIVNSPEPMSRMRVVTSKDLAGQALKVLQRSGVLHAEESTELTPVDRDAIESERRQVSTLLANIDDVLAYIPGDRVVKLKADVDVFYTRPLSEISEDTKRQCTKLTVMHERVRKLEAEQREMNELKAVVSELAPKAELSIADLGFTGKHLFSRLAAFPRDVFQAMNAQFERYALSQETVEVGESSYLYFIGNSRDIEAAEASIADAGGRLMSVPQESTSLVQFASKSDTESTRIAGELTRLHADIEVQTTENLENLVLLREALLAESQRLGVLEQACEAKYVTLIEGWVPRASVQQATGDLREHIGYVYVDSRDVRPSEEPPSKLRNLKALRPFETVVNLFGTPKYREWDPTPIIAYSFAFFFGVMLGDAVYGLLLMLITRYFLPKLVDDPSTDGFRQFRTLMYICAGSAVVVGALTGTYLGDFFTKFLHAPNLALSKSIQAVYLDTMTFIVISLGIGLIHVNIGHVLMLIRGIKERKKDVIIGRAGLFLLQIAGIPWILHFIGSDVLPIPVIVYSYLQYAILLSIVLIIVGQLMEQGPFLGSIFWIFKVTGILGDVMSYARLAGVGLATYYLAYCFNLMSTLIANMMPAGFVRIVLGTLIAVAILLFGHTLNLVLSSITCFVHSLRLCFVEFLFQFYEGGGHEYRPLRIRKRDLVTVKAKA
ncbi:MAG: hypothetical protein JW846_07700 [Dehalococcoidia bacterium]|nr:hypothetical protein [Dehalococcoidia bacterium]